MLGRGVFLVVSQRSSRLSSAAWIPFCLVFFSHPQSYVGARQVHPSRDETLCLEKGDRRVV